MCTCSLALTSTHTGTHTYRNLWSYMLGIVLVRKRVLVPVLVPPVTSIMHTDRLSLEVDVVFEIFHVKNVIDIMQFGLCWLVRVHVHVCVGKCRCMYSFDRMYCSQTELFHCPVYDHSAAKRRMESAVTVVIVN